MGNELVGAFKLWESEEEVGAIWIVRKRRRESSFLSRVAPRPGQRAPLLLLHYFFLSFVALSLYFNSAMDRTSRSQDCLIWLKTQTRLPDQLAFVAC
ncbi:hypothetical protein SLA2020_419190 [Shorea laevis]